MDTKHINALLDHVRAVHGLTSDDALAKELGVNNMIVYRLRRGIMQKGARVLFTLVTQYPEVIMETTTTSPDALKQESRAA
jgi:hypothetical protein